MPLELNCSIEEYVERVVDEKLDELTERIERQDVVIAKLRAEISSLRPKPIARRGHDIDSARVDLR